MAANWLERVIRELRAMAIFSHPLSDHTTALSSRTSNNLRTTMGLKPTEALIQKQISTPVLKTAPGSTSLPPPSSSFMNLPSEIRILILSHCTPTPSNERLNVHLMDAFLTLLRVSKTIQYETYIACLPLIPIALWSKQDVLSFQALLRQNKQLGCLVRYIWIGTGKWDEEEILQGTIEIIGCLTQLKSIACGEYLLAQCVNKSMLASTVERVTLMNVEMDVEYRARGVKQVRLCIGVYSTSNRFPDVEMLCFNARRMNVKDERVLAAFEALDEWTESVHGFVLVEKDPRRESTSGLEVRFSVTGKNGRPDMYSVVVPARWTEWDFWSAEAIGSGVWNVCGL